MRRTPIFSLFPAVLFALAAPAGDMERQARELAEEVLAGRELRVRVYNDWQADPRTYELLSVPLDGLSVKFDGVKKAFPTISKSAVIVVAGQDQTDEAAAAVINDFVYVENYRDGKSLRIWPSWPEIPGYTHLVFTDALGDPIPRASVEILISGYFHDSKQIHLGKGALDENGRLKPPVLDNSVFRLAFVVSHPKYGKAGVEKDLRGTKPDSDVVRYVVPLVPMDSEAATRAIQGYVVDTEGVGLEAIPVTGGFLIIDRSRISSYKGTHSWSITDEHGWFTMYRPIEKDGELSRSLVPADTQYVLSITPPKSRNLYENSRHMVVAGTQTLITLSAMNPDKYFHTFTFEDDEGMISEPQELANINIALWREQKIWSQLEYDEWKDGCYLQEGRLTAGKIRGKSFVFEAIELTADSPEELAFTPGRQIVYTGKVIDDKSAEPMVDVLVLVKSSRPSGDALTQIYRQKDLLRSRALKDSVKTPSDKALFQYNDRVTLTHADGSYQVRFNPGRRRRLSYFIALEEGYFAEPIRAANYTPNADGIVKLPVIRLLSVQAASPRTFLFEDESGTAITDPNMLEKIQFKVELNNRSSQQYSYSKLTQSTWFKPGTYSATLDSEGRHYVFEPVEITADSPQEIILRVKEVRQLTIAYQGRVVHGITGAPMPGAIVVNQFRPDYGDASGIRPEQWDAIHSMGPELDPDDRALTPLRQAFGFQKITRADAAGKFQIALERKMTLGPAHLIAVEQDYLGAKQQLTYTVPIDRNSSEPVRLKEFEPDESGYVTLPPMKLFPAATIIIEPNVPYVSDPRDAVRFDFRTPPDDPTPWLNDLWATPRSTGGTSSLQKSSLTPHQPDSVYVPASVELTLRIDPRQSQKAPVTIGGIKLKQGQVLDLGRIDFPETLKVVVKVVNSAGEPVKGVPVLCQDADGFVSGLRSITDESGTTEVDVAPYSRGQFFVRYFDKSTRENIREEIAYEVGGQEDAGRQFTLRISDEMLYQLFK